MAKRNNPSVQWAKFSIGHKKYHMIWKGFIPLFFKWEGERGQCHELRHAYKKASKSEISKSSKGQCLTHHIYHRVGVWWKKSRGKSHFSHQKNSLKYFWCLLFFTKWILIMMPYSNLITKRVRWKLKFWTCFVIKPLSEIKLWVKHHYQDSFCKK